MRTIHGLENLTTPFRRTVVTIGNFDGVHRAHQQLLAQAGLFAAESGAPVVVVTFEPHPFAVVAPTRVPPKLMTLAEKLRLLEGLGVDVTVVIRSEPALLGMEPEEFVFEIIRDRFSPTHIVEGPSFGFGKGRRGDVVLLKALACQFGCRVHVVDPVRLSFDGEQEVMVSSSLIRSLLSQGYVRRAAICLGRPYTLIGKVVRGDQRGRSLGFPTANIDPSDCLVPREGVYAGRAVMGERALTAAISVGHAATFGGIDRRVEAHLLDFSEDIYGADMRLEFHRYLRPQQKFDSADALVRQLRLDVQAARVVESGGTENSASNNEASR